MIGVGGHVSGVLINERGRPIMGVESAREAHGVAAARDCPKHQMGSNATQILMTSVVHDVSLH